MKKNILLQGTESDSNSSLLSSIVSYKAQSIAIQINFLLKYEVYLNRIIFIILTRINAKSPLYSLYQT